MTRFKGGFSVRVFTCLIIFTLCGRIHGNERVKVVTVLEEHDAILPCSLSTKENIESKLFVWRKDGQKEVFLFDAGLHSNKGLDSPDLQFEGRVSYFPDQLMNGNASIKIRNTKATDSGSYTCDFPRLQLSQTFHIELLVVDSILTTVTPEIISTGPPTGWIGWILFVILLLLVLGGVLYVKRAYDITPIKCCLLCWKSGPGKPQGAVAAPKPNIKVLDATDDGVRLQCDVQGASPKPKVEWKDRAGNILPVEKPQISFRGGLYYITLLTTVTKTGNYHCVVTQKEIHHQTEAEIFVYFNGRQPPENGSEKPPMSDPEEVISLRTDPLLPGSDVPEQTSHV